MDEYSYNNDCMGGKTIATQTGLAAEKAAYDSLKRSKAAKKAAATRKRNSPPTCVEYCKETKKALNKKRKKKANTKKAAGSASSGTSPVTALINNHLYQEYASSVNPLKTASAQLLHKALTFSDGTYTGIKPTIREENRLKILATLNEEYATEQLNQVKNYQKKFMKEINSNLLDNYY